MPYFPPAATAGHTIEDEGTPLTQRSNLNFTGAGVAVTDAGGKTVVTIGGGAAFAITSVDVPFTDGDTLRRVTITDAGVSTSSKLICNIIRPDTADDSEDMGWLYSVNVVKVATGSFDVLIVAKAWGFDDGTAAILNETVKLQYSIA